MKKNLTAIIILAILIVGGYLLFGGSSEKMETLGSGEDLTPLSLSDADKRSLEQSGIKAKSGEDMSVKNLATVRSSSEISAIERDLDETNTDDLDAELSEMDKAMSGL